MTDPLLPQSVGAVQHGAAPVCNLFINLNIWPFVDAYKHLCLGGI